MEDALKQYLLNILANTHLTVYAKTVWIAVVLCGLDQGDIMANEVVQTVMKRTGLCRAVVKQSLEQIDILCFNRVWNERDSLNEYLVGRQEK
jgi:hypothetical protein